MPAAKSNTPTLKSIVDRVYRLEDEKQILSDDIKEIYVEAKAQGWNVKAIRKIIREQRKPPDAEVEAIIETYKHKLGMLADTPLGQAAIASVTAEAPFHPPPETDEPRVAEPA